MPVIALEPGYGGIVRDKVEAFNGAQLLFVLWERHLMIACPIALPVPPTLRFGELVQGVLAQSVFARHPDWSAIDWSQAQWLLHGKPLAVDVTVDEGRTLAELGIGHKAFLTLRTPGLEGLDGSGN
ncbi:MAG: phenol hydroxylase subunit P4 [Proteobacteria bacterium]|nr:phenol hydroxylase subunit P4 [Pseudomonadota bacterium]